MAKLKIDVERTQTPRGREISRVACEGIISTPTIGDFRDQVGGMASEARDLFLDLSSVNYINSSGLGELVSIHDAMAKQNLSLVIVNDDPEVGRLITMLGLQSVLNIVHTAEEAMSFLDSGEQGHISDVESASGSAVTRGGGFVPVTSTPKPKLPEARILIALENDPHFARFLARCLSGQDGNSVLVTDREGALQAMEGGRVDIAILESGFAQTPGICSDLKLRTENGILSVIVIYSDAPQQGPVSAYRVCEDEYVVEPFEVRELVALAEAEFHRCKTESILFVQEACFEIATRDSAIAEVGEEIEKLLAQSELAEEQRDGYFYAVREAIDNARRHGNASDTGKLIEVLYVLDKEKITVTVGDEGEGFDWAAQMEKSKNVAPIEQARQRHSAGGYGGLGLGLMLRCTDKLEYISPGNVVKLTKYL